MKFTEKQLSNWRAYERVRLGARYNMYSPQAQAAAGLTSADYVFVMDNFSALSKAVSEADKS